jgi:outer membrane protein assembly factor BamD (BamD/ComL family)
MSVSSVGGNTLLSQLYVSQGTQNNQNQFQQIQSDFNQLGQDLQAGNLTQAQQDFATLQQALPGGQGQTQQTQQTTASPITQEFTALSQALQSGDLQGAQTAFATLQQDIQQEQGSGQVQHHHHHHGGGGSQGASSANSQQGNPIATAFSALSQALQSGDLAGAQSAFATLQQDLPQQFSGYGSNGSQTGTSLAATGSTLNVTA